jgi:hypothetical protein
MVTAAAISRPDTLAEDWNGMMSMNLELVTETAELCWPPTIRGSR